MLVLVLLFLYLCFIIILAFYQGAMCSSLKSRITWKSISLPVDIYIATQTAKQF